MNLDQRLADAGGRVREVNAERSLASIALREAVRDAASEGVSKTRIAELAGVSRQTVHNLLRD